MSYIGNMGDMDFTGSKFTCNQYFPCYSCSPCYLCCQLSIAFLKLHGITKATIATRRRKSPKARPSI